MWFYLIDKNGNKLRFLNVYSWYDKKTHIDLVPFSTNVGANIQDLVILDPPLGEKHDSGIRNFRLKRI